MKNSRLCAVLSLLVAAPLAACTRSAAAVNDAAPAVIPDAFGEYWFEGRAEITSYALEQARYGEVHPGTAVLIFVTEDVSRARHVKLDDPEGAGADRVPVLKLNLLEDFVTGVYDYSLMTSVFTPLDARRDGGTLKVTTSAQDWCGHTFQQLDRTARGYREQLHSYFESEGERDRELAATLLEDELWNRIRIAPESLPTGEVELVPGTRFQRLRHTSGEARRAHARLGEDPDDPALSRYVLEYPELERTLTIRFQRAFPHAIEGWEETRLSGFGAGAQRLTTRAVRKERRMLDYWNRHDLADRGLRAELGLE